ncbi:MAG TPA: LCP family protein [Mycobacteriales bacterium]|nr:LCP family protein [Mycobacteriales bacterium]
MAGKRRAGRRSSTPASAQPAAPVAPTTSGAPAAQKSRRQLRAERRQRQRRLGVVGVVVVVVAVLVVAAAVGFGVHRATSGSSTPKDVQTTVLISLRGDDGSALASMLAAHDVKQKHGLELLLPGRLITDVCGFGTQQFGQILSLPNGEQLAKRALSQLLGDVTIDGTWTMTTADLAHLVDAVGGVTVNVDVNVTRPGAGGTTVVVLQSGKQHLNGSQASAFASYQAAGEDATAVLSRFQAVFQAVVDALPAKSAQAQAVLTRAGAVSSLPAAQLSGLLTALAKDEQTNALLPLDLPTKPIDTGGGPNAYRVDQAQVTSLVNQQLAASLPASAGQKHPSVLIQNGTGTPGLVQSACDRLLPAGYVFAGSGNAPTFNYKTSQVIVFDSTIAAARVGDDVARRLGLPIGDVVASTQGQNVADVVVILGRDYRG